MLHQPEIVAVVRSLSRPFGGVDVLRIAPPVRRDALGWDARQGARPGRPSCRAPIPGVEDSDETAAGGIAGTIEPAVPGVGLFGKRAGRCRASRRSLASVNRRCRTKPSTGAG
jgi:hypothetical protein